MTTIFQILAVILAGVTAYFLWQDARESAFVSGVLVACAYFLSLRFKIKEKLKSGRQTEDDNSSDDGDN